MSQYKDTELLDCLTPVSQSALSVGDNRAKSRRKREKFFFIIMTNTVLNYTNFQSPATFFMLVVSKDSSFCASKRIG